MKIKNIPAPLKIIPFYFFILLALIIFIPFGNNSGNKHKEIKSSLHQISLNPNKSSSKKIYLSKEKLKFYFTAEEYLDYLTNQISFKNLNFKIKTIEKGDNFWQIAKDNKIDLKTLTSVNIFLESLTAKIGQKIIIPSLKGVINFVPEIASLKLLTKTAQQEIMVETLPRYYEYYSFLWGKKKFITIFTKNKEKTNPTPYNEPISEENNIRKIFPTEKEFRDYLTQEVTFEDLSFKIITIKRGDNFWKIAKKYKININSLIGTNLYWESLLARINQKIIVPSKKGSLHFISKIEEIESLPEIYDTDPENILIEKLPEYHSKDDQKKIIAVFIKNEKPLTANMTAQLAKQFTQRELFRSPLGGRLSSFFGNRKHPIFKRQKFHNGIDIAAKYGTLVGAARGGKVIFTGWKRGYGKSIVIVHDQGYKTLYGHLSKILTRKGRRVKPGTLIGRVGSTGLSTGPHLHFTIWKNKKLINPMDVLW